MSWKLSEWNALFAPRPSVPMSFEDIEAGVKYLRDNNYPKPEDCPEVECPKYRPTCMLGICRIAVGMCGD